MPIQKTANITASDINTILGTPNAYVSFGAVANVWFGSAANVYMGKDFADTFTNTQVSSKVVPTVSATDPNDWWHRGLYCSGETITISGDGNRMAVAKQSYGVSVYSWVNNSWSLDATLTTASQGYTSVALNYDGTTLAVGYNYYTVASMNYSGGIFVWTKSGSTWTQQGGVLTPTGYTIRTGFTLGPQAGDAGQLQISDDGNTLAVGGPGDSGTRDANAVNTQEGAVYVFTRSGGVWTQQARLTSAARFGVLVNTYDQQLGYSLSLSADGNTIVAGGPRDDTSWGAVVVFVRSGTTWSQQFRIENDGTTYNSYLGWRVAASSDGNTFAATYVDYTAPTTARVAVFTRSGTTWSLQQKFGTPVSDYAAHTTFTDNNTFVFGGLYVYTRSGSTWSLAQTLSNDKGALGGFGWGTSNGGNIMVTTGSTGLSAGMVLYTRNGATYTQNGPTYYAQPYGNLAVAGFGKTSVVMMDGNNFLVQETGFRPNTAITTVNSSTIGSSFIPNYQITGRIEVSGDRLTLVAGTMTANLTGVVNGGCVVYSNNAGTLTQQALIQPPDINGYISLDPLISGDGKTLVLYGAGNYAYFGSVWIYTKSGSSWSLQQKLDYPSGSFIGFAGAAAISSDGNTLAVGTPTESTNLGVVRVYTRSAGVWSLQTTITAVRKGSGVGAIQFGTSVSLSGDGNTMAIGAPQDTLSGATSPVTGAVHIYTRSGSTWTLKASLQPAVTAALGFSVVLSGDGWSLLATAGYLDGYKGGAYLYTRQNQAADTWTQKYKIQPSDAAVNTYVGGIGTRGASFNRGANKIVLGNYQNEGVWLFV